MIVANEPTPFWDGSDAIIHFEAWKHAVNWQSEWGVVDLPPTRLNGPSGAWVDEHILKPLGVSREEACITDCLDMARLNAGQASRVEDTYKPFATAFGLPVCTLRPVPAGENGIVAETRDSHLERLRAELRFCGPETVVTLGNAALRVAKLLFDSVDPDPGRQLIGDTYGTTVRASFDGKIVTWVPLVHPRSGERTNPWPDVHAAWEQEMA
jgi:uracil-DNA glycosylase